MTVGIDCEQDRIEQDRIDFVRYERVYSERQDPLVVLHLRVIKCKVCRQGVGVNHKGCQGRNHGRRIHHGFLLTVFISGHILHCILFETKRFVFTARGRTDDWFLLFFGFSPYFLWVCLSVCFSSSPIKWCVSNTRGEKFPPLFPVNNRRPQIATPRRPSFMHGISFSPSASPLRSLTLCYGLLGPYPWRRRQKSGCFLLPLLQCIKQFCYNFVK